MFSKIFTGFIVLLIFLVRNIESSTISNEISVETGNDSEFMLNVTKIIKQMNFARFNVAITTLQDIEWDTFAEGKEASLMNTTLLTVQNILNETIASNCGLLNMTQIIDRIHGTKSDSDKIKIFKVLMFGALQHILATCKISESSTAFHLAYAIRHHKRTALHEMATNYFNGYLKLLMNSFHGCIRSIIMNPSLAGFSI